MSADVLLFPLGRQPWQADAHVQPEVLLEHVLKLAAFDVWVLLPLRAAKSRLALPQEVVTRAPLAAFLSSITPATRARTASAPTGVAACD